MPRRCIAAVLTVYLGFGFAVTTQVAAQTGDRPAGVTAKRENVVDATAEPTSAVDLTKQTVVFRQVSVDPQNENGSCAAIDVDHDGQTDIVCGDWWYRAPDWTRHHVRQVERIRGRNDDYSSQPMDVNEDGWTDLISVNYRSQSLYWVRHPGESIRRNPDTPWDTFPIDQPGPAETGRLADVDGDGRLDILPNGTKYAAWYERLPLTAANGAMPDWRRHALPAEAAGHGIGFGDLNGDGRGDVVTPVGWFEGPANPRGDRWSHHDDFRLHRDAGLPILVHDVDRDGDADIIWSRGHNIGLYWLEQTVQPGADASRWTMHVIDTSTSSNHSLLLADIDRDGHQDLVAGKRYLGHDGRDPGEYDLLPISWYTFQPQSSTWQRHVVSPPDDVGFDLDPKAADLDGDGDVDIIAPSRNGLHLFVNELADPAIAASDATLGQGDAHPAANPIDHRVPFVFQQNGVEPASDATRFEWARRRVRILDGMQLAMGPLPGPERRVPLDVQTLSETDEGKYMRRKITYAAETGSRVHAWLLLPKDQARPAAAMLCLHPTTSIGKDIVAGLGGLPNRNYAHELAERGFVCLAPDYPSFGEDTDYDFNADTYVSGSMKAIWNNLRAVDLLESMPTVNPDAIGAIGHSLGGHNALFTAAFDQRVRAVVTSCGFTAFHRYYEGKLAGWTSDRYMPIIRDQYDNNPDRVPFDFHEVLAVLAPRPVFVSAPLHDSNFEVEGVREVIAAAGPVYDLTQAPGRLQVAYPDCEHDFPPEIREQVYQWLAKSLKLER